MESQLKLLIELQGLDTEISRLAKEKGMIPQEIQSLERKFLEAESQLEGVKRNLEDLHKRRRGRERELDQHTEEMKKRHGRLLEVKTNKEYSAILHEIQTLKEKQSALEDEILGLMETIERQTREVGIQAEQLSKEREICGQKKGEWEEKLSAIEARFAAFLEERAERVTHIDPNLVQNYRRIYENRQGLAVVSIKERSCSGCFVTLTPQTCNEIKRNDRIFNCSNCNRILYWKE